MYAADEQDWWYDDVEVYYLDDGDDDWEDDGDVYLADDAEDNPQVLQQAAGVVEEAFTTYVDACKRMRDLAGERTRVLPDRCDRAGLGRRRRGQWPRKKQRVSAWQG